MIPREMMLSIEEEGEEEKTEEEEDRIQTLDQGREGELQNAPKGQEFSHSLYYV